MRTSPTFPRTSQCANVCCSGGGVRRRKGLRLPETGLKSQNSLTSLYHTFSPAFKSPSSNVFVALALLLLNCGSGPTCVQSKYYDDSSTSDEAFLVGGRHQSTHLTYSTSHSSAHYPYIPSGNWTEVGVSPPVLNLATKAHIEVNATCGERSPETYCKLVEHAQERWNSRRSNVRTSQCQVCDAHSSDKGKRHPIRYTIDGSNRWWQSPTLQNGRHFEWVTITIDLKQIYQVAYIIIKSAISPRPGNWILERSLDGVYYLPWQYYAITDDECWNRYRIRAKPGKPSYASDEEVICTSYYSSIYPFEGGEIHTSLVNGRPGADGPSEQLTRFTMARYVRLRFQKIRTLHGELMTGGGEALDKSVLRRYFYSIKDISIGGHCVCFGHANACVMDQESHSEKCMCQHNTCGERCDICCPLYNQYPWGAGNSTDSATCQKCQCFGHADSCVYDQQIHEEKRSINIVGEYDGGGVCLDCKDYTTGVNCDMCVEGYYRPKGVPPEDPNPCQKCACHEEGSTGKCIRGEDEATKYREDFGLDLQPGDCICREGFEGRNCDRCQMGFKNFPRCSPCPCNIAGITNTDCGGDCQCKRNVEGAVCSNCKSGFFDLRKENEEGCTACFCHGVSSTCRASNFTIIQVSDGQNWFVTDLHGTKTVPAVQITPQVDEENDDEDQHDSALLMNGKSYQIANEEFTQFSEYYWTTMPILPAAAPSGLEQRMSRFSGNKIHSYGLNVTFRVSWVQARGDISGRPIPNYDVIIQGSGSMLGFGYATHDGNNATISVVLNEHNCMILPDVDNNIIKIQVTRSAGGRGGPRGVRCSRHIVMEVLSNVRRLLFRAKFRTDQMEGMMHWAFMESAWVNREHQPQLGEGVVVVPGSKATSVEVCECPVGHAGTSCEQCSYGYRRSSHTSSWLTECVKCNCYGHSESCDAEGNCLKCDHNTMGNQCEFCEEGYYGEPSQTQGSAACRKCECPLGLPSNNFSPTCQVKGNSYECTTCPPGYEGDYCERCANGYYGNPTHPGDYCKPCLCSSMSTGAGEGNSSRVDICDHLTGECLICPRNTVGWNCDECAPGHYGNPLNGSCVPCTCSEVGSSSTSSCHHETGQCACKPNFGGRACNKCLEGHGNPLEGCVTCGCNGLGSVDSVCDVLTGQCPCKPGVGGRYCNKCADNHFGFGGGRGCVPCDCDPLGCDRADLCDLQSGQCHCLPHVTGRRCDACEPGWWNLHSGKGCERCSCDSDGSFGGTCNGTTGQCICKPGVGGQRCAQCLEGHWGKNHVGCKQCDPCDKAGHICDPENGRCICPPNTEGERCEKCTVGYWGYSPIHGCKPCQCSSQGSVGPQCHPTTGKCSCQAGFEGDNCDQCRFGYFGYPSCQQCQCDQAGTLEDQCSGENGTCACDAATGQCGCKPNVVGANCDRCKTGYYGLDEENPDGCMQCFCFHRTNKCSQGYFKWQRFAMPASHDRSVGPLLRSDSQLKRMNDLLVIPDSARDVVIEKDISFGVPLYWQLPHIFLGDKVLSYNGNLRFHTHSIGGKPGFPSHVLATYPVVQIQGNHRLILEHYSLNPYTRGYYEVRLHEDDWRLKNGPYNGQVSKEVMMVALQNLQHILIRATHTPEVFNASLFNVSLDIAIPSPSNDKTVAHGIEVCDCPPQYNSTSCQNPRIGWYRWYKRDYITSTVIIDLVGEARRCDCNGRASSCDTETGRCQNCLENTSGARCEMCAEGYYGNPIRGRCHACPCPTVWNNHAKACHQRIPYPQWPPPLPHDVAVPQNFKWHCTCLQGYTGPQCDRCDYGFYGRPWERGSGSRCVPCRCNPYGSVSDECDEITGQCNCRPGVTGRDCSKCKDRHVIIGKECTSCDDQCTGTLLNDLVLINEKLSRLKVDPEAVLVWKKMVNVDESSRTALVRWNNGKAVELFLEDLPNYRNLANILAFRMTELGKACEKSLTDSYMVAERGKILADTLEATVRGIRDCVKNLNEFALRPTSAEREKLIEQELGDLISQLEQVSMDLQEGTNAAEEELEEINELFEELLLKISSGKAGKMVEWMKETRKKLEQLADWLAKCRVTVDDALRVMILAKEHKDNLDSNMALLNSLASQLNENVRESETRVNEGGYLNTELEQVLLMIEDILRDFRNTTKELEIRDNILFDQVPLYRVLYAQPAFDHELELIMQHKYIEGIFGPLVGNGNGTRAGIQAVTAFERMINSFKMAYDVAKNTTLVGKQTEDYINEISDTYPSGQMLETSSRLVDAALEISAQLENGQLRRNLSDCKNGADKHQWNVKLGNETLRHMNTKLDGYLEQSMKIPELVERIEEISETVAETSQFVMEIDSKVNSELKARIDAIRGGAPFDSVDAAISVNRVSHRIPQVEHDLIQAERRLQETSIKHKEDLEDRLKYLKALILQSRHKANTVGVSLGPDDTGTCFRVYTLSQLMDESTTFLRFNFAPTGTADSLLVYWPSSLNEDFIAIEMVNLHVKVSWDLGSGPRSLTHPTKLHPVSIDSDDPDHWWEIILERIGSSITVDVKPISVDPTVPLAANQTKPLKYINTEEEATLLNLAPGDYLHIGGMSRETRMGLVDNGVLSGCIHNLRVNQKEVGLWNFARTEGCKPCVECSAVTIDAIRGSGDSEYYFDGRGYAVMERIQSQTFNPRFFDVSFEFKTFSENGLLFLTVNQTVGQIISVELKDGRLLMQVRHRWGAQEEKDILRVETDPLDARYNTGEWTQVRALWVFQKGKQTAKLIVGKKDFTQEKRPTGDNKQLSLKLFRGIYQIGGVSPSFDPGKWDHVLPVIIPYVGCIKNLLVDGNTYDPLGGNYFGVESPCGGKSVYLTSFEGDGYAEFGSVPIGKNYKMGFAFKTLQARGLMLLSTFARGLESPDEHYYAVYMDQGKVYVQIGVPQGPFDLVSNGTRYDDGRFHSLRFFKKGRKLLLYMDDEEVMELRIPKQAASTNVNAPTSRGLFIGGTTPAIQQKFTETPLQVSSAGFQGCIQNLYFGDELLNFNYPVSHANQSLGQCGQHHEPDPLVLKYQYTNTGIDSSAVVRMTELECASGAASLDSDGPVFIPQEEPFKAWHFGDNPNSYATLNLGSKLLKNSFNITFDFRSFYPNGMILQGLKRRSNGGYCLMSFLKDGQVIVKLHGNRPQDLVSSVSGLNDGKWHHVEIVKAEDKMYLHIDFRNATQTQVPKIKPIGKMHIGGVPSDGHDCLENSIHKPEYFKGCLKNFIVNSHFYSLDSNSAQLSNVSPCLMIVQRGMFFRSGSFVIYSHNFTMGNILEVQLDFKSDSLNGMLLSLQPNKPGSRYPEFSIFLRDGKVIARETLSGDEYYEASANFLPNKGYVCDGNWHNIRAEYERGSITLRVDGGTPIFALADPETSHSRLAQNSEEGEGRGREVGGVRNEAILPSTVATIYIGGMDDGASRSSKKPQFHGCIRNIVLNRQIRDWTDMALTHNVYLNSCPL